MRLVFCLLLTLSMGLVSAQENFPRFRQAVFIEAGGLSPFYSINLEKILTEGKVLSYALRGGVAYLPEKTVSAPLGMHIFTTGGDHHFQLTAGLTPFGQDILTFSLQESDTYLFIGTGPGYRYQKSGNHLVFMAGILPMVKLDPSKNGLIGPDPRFIFSGNLALGYAW